MLFRSMFSDELNDTVMVSPGLALAGFVLSEDIETDESVGTVLSKLTDDESVVLLTGVPAFDARSENDIKNDTVPSVSPDCIWYVADHDEFAPDTLAECPSMVTVGVWMFSDEINDTVMVSPGLALAVFRLSEAIVTEDNACADLSITMAEAELVATLPSESVVLILTW